MKQNSVSSSNPSPRVVAMVAAVVIGLGSQTAKAQVTPAAGYTPPDDTPSIKVGAVIFADYSYQNAPVSKDPAGAEYNPNGFNMTRGYVNVTGNISHLVSFRITPDVTRMTTTGTGVSTSLDGSLAFRVKYGYLQVNLDDWMPKGSFVRFGVQQTPYIDNIEGPYRYRFQGTVLIEREGYMSSADVGASFRLNFPQNWGDVHVGIFNGEGYSKPEVNQMKAFMARVGVRPLHTHPILKNWRVQGFWSHDSYMNNAPRNRSAFNTMFEHPYINAGFDYVWTKDKVSSALTSGKDLYPTLDGKGWSIWLTPRKPFADGSSVEALVRYDHWKPGGTASATAITSPGGLNQRTIAGVAYWFPKQGSVAAALLLDYDQVKFSNWTPSKPTQQRIFVHSLISF